MSAHRVLRDLFRAFESVGPGIGNDPGNAGTIAPTTWGQVYSIVTAGAETMTLARPDKAGILVTVALDTDGGDLTLTVTGGYNADGDTSITFADAGDMVVFLSVKTGTTYKWIAIAQEGTNVGAETGDFDALFIGGTEITATAAEINNAADDSLHTQAIVVAGAVNVSGTINRVTLTNAINGAITLAAPSAAMMGKLLTIEYIGVGTNNTTLALTNVQGGTAVTTATFNAANETLVLVGGELKWNVVKEVGVTLS